MAEGMSGQEFKVNLSVDVSAFREAMRRAGESVGRFVAAMSAPWPEPGHLGVPEVVCEAWYAGDHASAGRHEFFAALGQSCPKCKAEV